jgi:hypothetical protein
VRLQPLGHPSVARPSETRADGDSTGGHAGASRGAGRFPRESKGKPMKGNKSKKAFICFHLFFRIESFQGLKSDSNKKFPPRLR